MGNCCKPNTPNVDTNIEGNNCCWKWNCPSKCINECEDRCSSNCCVIIINKSGSRKDLGKEINEITKIPTP